MFLVLVEQTNCEKLAEFLTKLPGNGALRSRVAASEKLSPSKKMKICQCGINPNYLIKKAFQALNYAYLCNNS